MTVSTELARTTRTFTGAETSIATGLIAEAAEHVSVRMTDAATGADTALVRDTHFTSSLSVAGEIILAPISLPYAAGTLTITRRTPGVSASDFLPEKYEAPAIELEIDRAIRRDNELRATLGAVDAEALRVKPGQTAPRPLDIPALSGKFLSVDGGGQIVGVPASAGSGVTTTQILDSTAMGRTLMTLASAAGLSALLAIPNLYATRGALASASFSGVTPPDAVVVARYGASDAPSLHRMVKLAGAPSGLPAAATTQTASGQWYQLAEPVITSAMVGASAVTAAEVAYALDAYLMLGAAETAYISIDPSAGGDTNKAVKWLHGKALGGAATKFRAGCYMKLADGAHTLNTNWPVYNDGGLVDVRGSGTDFITITGINYANVSGTQWRATVTLASALPARVVAGCALGLQALDGDNDAGAAMGAQSVETIAGDRLSFTCLFRCARGALVSPTTLTSGTSPSTSLAYNKVLVPKALLICQASGWGGGSDEGFINLWTGGKMSASDVSLGFSATGGVGTAHDMVFFRGEGSYFYGYQNVVIGGGGTTGKVLRGYAGQAHFTKCCIGPAGSAPELLELAARSAVEFERCSLGMSEGQSAASGGNSFVQFAQNHIAGGSEFIRVTDHGKASLSTCTIWCASEAANAVLGQITYDTVSLRRCTTGLAWSAGGFHHDFGQITFDGFGAQCQANALPGVESSGGGWLKATGRALTPGGERISIANNAIVEIPLGGTGGKIDGLCGTVPEFGFAVFVDIESPGTILEVEKLGSKVATATGAFTLPANATKVTLSVYEKTAGNYVLRIGNEAGASRPMHVFLRGPIYFNGTFVVV